MIKNVHYNPLKLWWDGKTRVLNPGESLPQEVSGWDEGVEKFFKSKLGAEIELLNEDGSPIKVVENLADKTHDELIDEVSKLRAELDALRGQDVEETPSQPSGDESDAPQGVQPLDNQGE